MNRKGQAAMEFLMTYGWAILVVLAAIGALAYFGVLSPDRFLQDKCLITGGFSCGEYKITSTQVQMNVQNNLGVDVSYANVTLTGTSGSACSAVNSTTNLMNGAMTGLIDFSCAITGTKFKGDIVVVYQKSGESVTHSATGSISGKVET